MKYNFIDRARIILSPRSAPITGFQVIAGNRVLSVKDAAKAKNNKGLQKN